MMPQQQIGGRNVQRINRYTPQQKELFNQQFGFLGPESYLYKLAQGDPQLMEQMERGALRDFGALQGNTASRFSGMGTGGRHSSGFQLEQGAQARSLQERLQAQRGQMQQQAIKDLMGLSNQLLNQDPYSTFLVEPEQKSEWWQKAISGLSPVAGTAIGTYFGNPALGNQLGTAFGQAFGGR